MSKSIILMRHAKSSWAYDLPDKDRPLKARGKNDAKLVAQAFKTHNIKIDKAYSSPAKRAYDTCKIFFENIDLNLKDVSVTTKLYDFGGDSVFNFIVQLPQHYQTVMLFGHNYAFTAMLNQLGNQPLDNLPTSGMVKINFEANHWNTITKGNTQFILIPKPLR